MMRSAGLGLVALLFAARSTFAQSPEWTAIVNVRPDPTPYIADWESDPLIVTLVLSYTGGAGVTFHLQGSILRGATPIVGGRSTAFEFVRPSQLILTTRDGIWERNSVTYETALRDVIERTGRIPDGEYQFCVDVRQGLPEAAGTLLTRDCAPFSITAPQPPSLVSPADGDSVRLLYPTFVWTPVLAGANARIRYHLRIAPVLPGQSPLDALGNVPHFEDDLATTVLNYPSVALPMVDSTRYVWQVQALDDAGQPVGERQGKSEAWTFTFHPHGTVIAARDSTPQPGEPVVALFRWGGVEVKVLSLSDSSLDNYSGVGRVKIVPGLLEPSFEFRSVRLDSAGAVVRYAPRHVISFANGLGVTDAPLQDLPGAPFWLDVVQLALVADSGGDQYVALSGAAALHLGLGTADSTAAPPAASGVPWPCDNIATTPGEQLLPTLTVCREALDALAGQDSIRLSQVRQDYQELRPQSLVFRLDQLRVESDGPRGTASLGGDFVTGLFGLGDARLTLIADSTTLILGGRNGQVSLQGSVRLPSGAGLTAVPTLSAAVGANAAADPALLLPFRAVQVDGDGDAVMLTGGLPRARVGATGLTIESAAATIDLSAKSSPGGRAPGWRGVFLDSVSVSLPGAWQSAPLPAGGLAVDGSGLTGALAAGSLDRLGAAAFNGFSGVLDSLHLVFAAGALDAGTVTGRLRTEFLEADIPYAAYLTATGLDRAYTTIDPAQQVPMPAVGGHLKIERGEIAGASPAGVLTVDGKLTIDYQNIEAADLTVIGLRFTADGDIKFARNDGGGGGGAETEWAVFGYDAQRTLFKQFPVVPDSFGFGRGQNADERWFGLAGHFNLNDNLPLGIGTFRIFFQRDPDQHIWRISHVNVDRLLVVYQNAAVSFLGSVQYVENDPTYGTVFSAGLTMSIKNSISVGGSILLGATDGPSSFRYWFVNASLMLPPPGIQMGPLPLSIWGFKGGVYSRMRATIDTTTLVATYVPDSTIAFGLKAAVAIGTSANAGYIWNADLWLEAAVNTSGGLASLSLRGDYWLMTEVTRRSSRKLWGSVLVDLPLSRDVLHATMTLNAFMPPYISGTGWAELHFEPGNWYVNVGTPQRPDTFTLLPTDLDIPGTAYFMLDPERVSAGFAASLEQEKSWGIFRGSIAGGFEAAAEVRYRPFQATGDGELWGEISAEVYAGGDWYELLGGSGRATLHFRFPDPTGVWGRIRVRYRLLHGAVKGTYRARYRWGDTPDANESDADQFTLVAGTYPMAGDTAAPLSGFTFYLGMNESAQYAMDDDDVYRLRLSGTPVIERQAMQTLTTTLRGVTSARQVLAWQSIGTLVRDWEEERGTLILKAPGHASLEPGVNYRVRATFLLEKQDGSSWETIATADSTIEFRTTGQAVMIAQLITETDPPGSATPMYYGGADAGAVRVRFSNVHPDLTSGAVTGRLIASGTDTVQGTWGVGSYSRGAHPVIGDPTLYAFRPTAGALLPSTAYRFAVVSTDTSATEHRSVSFSTSRYATLVEHVTSSTQTVTSDRGVGPMTGSGSYLLSAKVTLAGPEAIGWNDIDSIEVVGLSGWEVTPRTRCQWPGGPNTQLPGPAVTRMNLCGATPTYENILDVTFSAPDDAELPPASTAALTIRLSHRREGWVSFSYPLPSLASEVAGAITAAGPIGGAGPGTGAAGAATGAVTTTPGVAGAGAAAGAAAGPVSTTPGVAGAGAAAAAGNVGPVGGAATGPSGTTVPPVTIDVTRVRP